MNGGTVPVGGIVQGGIGVGDGTVGVEVGGVPVTVEVGVRVTVLVRVAVGH